MSIITAAYNCEATVSKALESIERQIDVEIEYIFIDGASTDATIKIVNSHRNLVNHLVSEPDKGIYDAMNKGLALATGDVIGILNSDDFYLHPMVLKEVASVFKEDNSLDVVMGDIDFVAFDNINKIVRSISAVGFSPWMLRFGFMPPHPAIFVRKSAYDRVGHYRIDYKIAADFEFLVRLLLIDAAKYKTTGKNWVRMRTGGASTSGWRSKRTITREMLRALRENRVFSCTPILLLRLPIKFFKQMIW